MKAGSLLNVLKTLAAVSLAGMLMGNKGCKEQPQNQVVKTRELKKRVELGQITSAAFELPGGGRFDFQFVANAQIYDVLMETGKFTMPYNQPVASPQVSSSGVVKIASKMTDNDKSLVTSFKTEFGTQALQPPPEEVACLLNLPQAYIGGSVRSFEMVSSGGISIGFGPNGGFGAGGFPSASVMISKAQLEIGTVAYSPIRRRLLATGDATAKQTKVDLNLTINFGNFTLGPKYYFQSPLASVSKKALRAAVDNMVVQLDKEPWRTRVRNNADTHVMIEGGLDVGLKKGDVLEIYGETHEWEGDPCKSRYLGSIPTENPISVIKVTAVSDAYSVAEVIEQTDWNPQVGDIVKVRSLVEDAPVTPVN